MIHLPDAGHPIWSLVRLAILMTALYAILRLTASNFDYTEIRTIIWMFIAAAGIEGLGMFLPRHR